MNHLVLHKLKNEKLEDDMKFDIEQAKVLKILRFYIKLLFY